MCGANNATTGGGSTVILYNLKGRVQYSTTTTVVVAAFFLLLRLGNYKIMVFVAESVRERVSNVQHFNTSL